MNLSKEVNDFMKQHPVNSILSLKLVILYGSYYLGEKVGETIANLQIILF
ncbi:hypothetical protein ACWE42_23290 [Sutcliffiella cohnii]